MLGDNDTDGLTDGDNDGERDGDNDGDKDADGDGEAVPAHKAATSASLSALSKKATSSTTPSKYWLL